MNFDYYKISSALLAQEGNKTYNEITQLIVNDLGLVACSIWFIHDPRLSGYQRLGYNLGDFNETQKLSNLDYLAAKYILDNNKALILPDIRAVEIDSSNDLTLSLVSSLLFIGKEVLGVLLMWTDSSTYCQVKEDLVVINEKIGHDLSLGLKLHKYCSPKFTERLKHELEIANKIQTSLGPSIKPEVKGLSLVTRYIPANEVGGDYADYLITKAKKIGIAIGDVMGKGIPAALLMAMTRIVLRSEAVKDVFPHLVLQEVNSVLFPDLSRQGVFVTLFYALYEPATRTLLYSNAGHLYPILFHGRTGQWEYLKVKGPYIGGIELKEYAISGSQLNEGDIVLFYTDGLTEASNKEHEQFGVNRIIETLQETYLYDAESIADILSIKISEYTRENEKRDDITFIIFKLEAV